MRNAMIASVAALALFATGCATMTKETFILESAGAHVFEYSSPQVLDEAEKMLKERGYSVRRSAEQHALVTEWKEEMASSSIAGSMTRYLVEVFPIAPQQSRVRVTRNSATSQTAQSVSSMGVAATDSAGESSTVNDSRSMAAAREYASGAQGGSRRSVGNATQTRDLPFEWELMKRMEPEDAKELEAVASDKFR